jgi:hypothetical protein
MADESGPFSSQVGRGSNLSRARQASKPNLEIEAARARQVIKPVVNDPETLRISSLTAAHGGEGRHAGWLAVGIGLVAVAGAIVFVATRGPGLPAEQPEHVVPPTAPLRPNEEKVQLILRAAPPEATFRIDDGPSLENPYVGDVPRSVNKHTITAVAPGYIERMREVRFDSNLTLDLSLEKAQNGGERSTQHP